MQSHTSTFLAWQQAERAAAAAERIFFSYQSNLIHCQLHGVELPTPLPAEQVALAAALRAKASALLRSYLEEARIRARALR